MLSDSQQMTEFFFIVQLQKLRAILHRPKIMGNVTGKLGATNVKPKSSSKYR